MCKVDGKHDAATANYSYRLLYTTARGPVGCDPGFLVVVVLGIVELHLLYYGKSDDGRYLLQRRC